MGLIWRYFFAIASRMIFIVHSVYSLRETLFRIHVAEATEPINSSFWSLTIILALILIEGAYTIIIRKGNEYKFFWPSGFIYVLIMIAITCILESFLMDEEIKCFHSANKQLTLNTTVDENLKKLCELASLTKNDDQKLRAAVEIGMLGALVMGRWLLPRGELTRDQLSALLLTFIGNGADCIEFLNTWNDFPVLRNRNVTTTVLVLYSLSMLQFAVLTTKTTDEYLNKFCDDVVDPGAGSLVDNNNTETSTKSDKPAIPNYLQRMIKSKERKRKRLVRASHAAASTIHRSKAYNEHNVFAHDESMGNKLNYRCKENNKRSVQPAARYLQSLAHFGKWDEFAEALKLAQNQGFSTSPSLPWKRSNEPLRQVHEQSNDDVSANDSTSVLKRTKYWKNLTTKLNQDVFQTVISMVSLEIPYFLARVIFTCVYNVSSTTMVFYTTKNMVMIIFLIYRLWVIFSEGNMEEDGDDKQSVQRDAMNIK